MRVADLFSGFGGSSEGATRAGARVVYAANHNPLAVRVHQENHPHTRHVCQDLRQADWRDLPAHDGLIASPSCRGHSPGSRPGRRPFHDADRATAWAVVDCAEVTRPRWFIVENVPSFLKWDLYPHWLGALNALGYRTAVSLPVATRFGVPQLRERALIFGVLGRKAPTLEGDLRAAPPFGPCIEWDAPGWRPIAKAQPGARERFAAAQKRIGPRCLVQHVTGHRGISLDEPIRTITTKDQWCVLNGDVYRPLTIRETARGMGFRDDYRLPAGISRADAVRGFGNAVPPPMMTAGVECMREAA